MKKGMLVLWLSLLSFASQSEIFDFEAWTLDCSGKLGCTISQMIMGEHQGVAGTVGGVTYLHLIDKPILKVRFSSSAQQSKGVGLKVDRHKGLHLPITGCDKKVCEVNVVVDATLLHELKTGKVLSVAYINQTNKQLTFPVILNGFAQAYDNLPAQTKGVDAI